MYEFDYEHRLVDIGVGATTFTYDGAGNRLRAIRSGVETRYIYDAWGNLLAEANSSNTITRYYIHGLGLLAMVTPAGQTYTYHYNAIGNTIAITDQGQNMVNKYVYTPFGRLANEEEAFTQPFKFVGRHGIMSEPDGLHYMRARYYDAETGRFISEDPIGFAGGDLNLYAYVQNNPVMFIDPSGTNPALLYYFINTPIGQWFMRTVIFNASPGDGRL
ncbi:RHS repeat-associated core domain-containing protein, partial [Oceanicoccus sp.]|uniref:RHS repeat-associated core domain-containing protein n=1 Tax=Oceanicoccus sp. TaxID=2691044 RepID=UPI00262516DA